MVLLARRPVNSVVSRLVESRKKNYCRFVKKTAYKIALVIKLAYNGEQALGRVKKCDIIT